MSWTLKLAQKKSRGGRWAGPSSWPRRNQEEGGELDPSWPRRNQEEGGELGPSWPRRNQEEGGELDPSWPRRNQEEGGELDPQVGPEEIKSRVESWTSFCISCYLAAVLWTLSLWLLCKAVEIAIVWYTSLLAMQWQGDTALTLLWLFWRWSRASSVFRVGARGRAFTLSPHVPIPNHHITYQIKVQRLFSCFPASLCFGL